MRIHFYHPSDTPWDWRTATTAAQARTVDLAQRLARWGHYVTVFTNLPADAPDQGPGRTFMFWRPLSEFNPAVPDVVIGHGPPVEWPEPRGKRQIHVWLKDEGTGKPFDGTLNGRPMDRVAAELNASVYDHIGGHCVSTFRRGTYAHPNHFIYHHPWETESRRMWLRVGPGDVVLDIGSAVGSWTLPAAACGATVFAFDPGTDAGFLRRVVKENGFEDRVVVVGSFVSDVSDCQVLRATDIPWSSVPAEGEFPPVVQTVSIDDFVLEGYLDRVDFIKVDTDGGEREVLAGMANTLKRFRCPVVVETHTFLGVSVEEVTALLDQLGYDAEAVPMEEGYYYHVYGTARG